MASQFDQINDQKGTDDEQAIKPRQRRALPAAAQRNSNVDLGGNDFYRRLLADNADWRFDLNEGSQTSSANRCLRQQPRQHGFLSMHSIGGLFNNSALRAIDHFG